MLKNKGRCSVDASVDDLPLTVVFRDMEVETPIMSVRKMVRHKNDVKFTDNGGTITNRRTGRVINFHEHEGVYVLKLKVKGPDNDLEDTGFARQVPP